MNDILDGIAVAVTAENILYCLVGVAIGTIVGLLPGLGSASGVALLLPLTLGMEPVSALIMLAGIYYGSQYGGTISSVLIAMPGEAATVVTVIDGYQMARRGRAGQALAIAAVSSFVAGTVSIVLLMLLTPVLAGVALRFGPPEMFALMLLGLISVAGFVGDDRLKGYMMAVLGLLLACIGIDLTSGQSRLTFGQSDLLGGLGIIEVVIGLFAIAEVLKQVSKKERPPPIRTRLRDMVLNRDDLRRSAAPVARGTFLGFVLGVLPGAGSTLAAFFSYDVERRVNRKHRLEFGKGAIEGVAGPEASNNAAANGAFAPMLSLGIPGSATTAVLLGAFIAVGVQPGPLLMDQEPVLVWGLLASFYVGNIILLVLNLPMAPVFASLLRLRYVFIYPIVLVTAAIGAFASENRMWGMWVAIVFGMLGFIAARFGFPPAPLVLGLILGPKLEESLVQTSAMSGGDYGLFLQRPIALAIFAVILFLVVALPILGTIVQRRKKRLNAAVTAPADGRRRESTSDTGPEPGVQGPPASSSTKREDNDT